MANPFNIHSNCYNGRLLVSLFIEVDNNQLSIQDYDFTQAPVLRHGNITITSDSLKKHLSAECLLLGVHDVARVKRGRTRPLFEVDFTNLTELRKFCKSLEGKSHQNSSCFLAAVTVYTYKLFHMHTKPSHPSLAGQTF